MEDLSSGLEAVATPPRQHPEPRDVYISYHVSEGLRASAIEQALDRAGKTCFLDRLDLVAGRSDLEQREWAMAHSMRIAVLLGSEGASHVGAQEARIGLRESIQRRKQTIPVFLPGWDGRHSPSDWLDEAVPVDLREHFTEDSELTEAGLEQLVAAVSGLSPREFRAGAPQAPAARTARPPRLRALMVGIRGYKHYEDLVAVDDDVRAVRELLGGRGEGEWEIVPVVSATQNELVTATRKFFSEDVAEDDTLLFYFSGRGDHDDSGAYLAVAESEPDNLYGTAFSIILGLARYVARSPSRRKLVVLDCCFSGEASEAGTNWGEGAAVLMPSRQRIPANTGMSALTRAFVNTWAGGARTTGELLGTLRADSAVDVRVNMSFDHEIPLPATPAPAAVARPRTAVRLTFDDQGDLYVKLSQDGGKGRCSETRGWLRDRHALVANLINLVDAVVSLVPAERIPTASLREAMLSLGSDLLSSALSEHMREQLGGDLEQLPNLHLELNCEDLAPAERDMWERLPWESVSLCRDRGRPVELERVVRGRARKNGGARPPRRVIAWNAYHGANPRHWTGPPDLLCRLLQADLSQAGDDTPALVVREPAWWEELFRKEIRVDRYDNALIHPDGPPHGRLRVDDVDAIVLLAPVSLRNGEPEMWLRVPAGLEPVKATSLVDQLRRWAISYLVIETVAGPVPALGAGGMRPSAALSLQATAQLATRLARELGVDVVAACHSPHFLNAASPHDDRPTPTTPSFSGTLLRELARPGVTLHDAAQEARARVAKSLLLEDTLDVGLPVVCRPEPARVAPDGAPAVGGLRSLIGPSVGRAGPTARGAGKR